MSSSILNIEDLLKELFTEEEIRLIYTINTDQETIENKLLKLLEVK